MAPASQLILLETRTAPALAFDHMQPGRQEQQQQHSRLLDLPLDVLEQIFAYLLVAPSEIYLGIVALEDRPPHHWHPACSLRREEPRDNRAGEDGLGRTPVCSHRRAQAPYDLCCSLLLVNRQLHLVAARMLYGRNAFAIDICVPTRDTEQQYDISKLRLEQIIPLNPVYHKLLRRVTFRHYNLWMLALPVRFFHSAMMHALRDKPGTFTAFRRRYDAEHEGFDFEVFAGWAPAASPAWLDDAVTSLATTSQPLITTRTSMRIEEVHQQMSTLWESPLHSDSHAPKTREEAHYVDLRVMSDPAVHAAPWHPDDPRSRPAARIFLARPRNDRPERPRQDDRMRQWDGAKAYSRFQTFLIGKSRGLQKAPVHNRQACGPRSTNQVWRAGPKGTKRRLFTAPMSLIVPSVCRVLREEQLKREDRLRRNTGVDALVVLSVDAEGFTEPSRWRRRPIDEWPSQYEFV
ncbi:hypothetical protein Q7P35_012397 [Cladosporium inversicolor]